VSLRDPLWLAACIVAALSGVLAVPVGHAQEPSVSSPINRPFLEPEFETWRRRFERPGREVYDRRQQIVMATGVRPGVTVADIGAGTGLFTRLFSAAVGRTGRVYAVDISPVFIDNVLRISRKMGQRNVEGIVNSPSDVMLPPASVDLAFICDTYHHFEHPEAMMTSIRRALKPGGGVVVIDFRKIPGFSTPWVMSHVRADEATVVREIEAAGFRLVEDRDFLRSNYFLRFTVARDRQ
jgi:predicted methyltransferase